MREFLKGLELDRETIDTIMAEYGKNVQGLREQIDEYKTKNSEYSTKIKDLEELSKNSTEIQKQLDEFKAKESNAKIDKDIMSVIGDKKFTSDYAKNGLINDIKAELQKEENKTLGVKDIFNNLTKDRADIFANPNQFQDMEGMANIDNNISREDFDKMSYNQRIEFKQSNPELFKKYND